MNLEESQNTEKKNNVKCVICGGDNVEDIGRTENSYGEFVLVCRCVDCDVEFEVKPK